MKHIVLSLACAAFVLGSPVYAAEADSDAKKPKRTWCVCKKQGKECADCKTCDDCQKAKKEWKGKRGGKKPE